MCRSFAPRLITRLVVRSFGRLRGLRMTLRGLRRYASLPCCLTCLAANHFVGVLDAFALVRIGLAQRADFGGGLSDFLLVDSGDGDVAGLGLDGDVDAFRNRETDRMRVAEGEDDFLPFDFGAV